MNAIRIRASRRSVLPLLLAGFLLFSPLPWISTSGGLSAQEEFEGRRKKGSEEIGKKKSDEKSDEKPDSEANTKKDDKKGDKKDDGDSQLEAQQEYVHSKIKSYLFPSSFAVLSDGRVSMMFSFRDKKDEHMRIFSGKFGGDMKAPFRYTIYQEEVVVGGDVGLRLSDKGMSLINCWWLDDVEAEMEYLQYITHHQRLIGALVYSNDKYRALGSNMGSQCVLFNRGRIAGRRRGKTQSVSFGQNVRAKLVVRSGVFEAHRQGKKRQASKYKQKTFSSGRIGFVWGGSNAVIVPSVKITGRLDYPKMSEVLKKYFGDE